MRETHLVDAAARTAPSRFAVPRWAPRPDEARVIRTAPWSRPIPAMLLADRDHVDLVLILNTLFGGMLAAGGRQRPQLRGRRRHRQRS